MLKRYDFEAVSGVYGSGCWIEKQADTDGEWMKASDVLPFIEWCAEQKCENPTNHVDREKANRAGTAEEFTSAITFIDCGKCIPCRAREEPGRS